MYPKIWLNKLVKDVRKLFPKVKALESINMQKIVNRKPNPYYGFPDDDKDIQTVKENFNADNPEDLLIYFVSHNCTDITEAILILPNWFMEMEQIAQN